MLKKIALWLYGRIIRRPVRWLFFHDLIVATNNFADVKWFGNRIWQNVLDLWTIQETICDIRPELLIECGTNRGGSSLFYAHLFDLIGHGSIISIDIERMHDIHHPRVTYLIGSSVSDDVIGKVRNCVDQTDGPVMVILDSDHTKAHVMRELELYAPFVTPGSYCLVQDGTIDTLWIFNRDRPGPLKAIEAFMRANSDFDIDQEKCERFLISHHPKGWLRRRSHE